MLQAYCRGFKGEFRLDTAHFALILAERISEDESTLSVDSRNLTTAPRQPVTARETGRGQLNTPMFGSII